MRTGDILGRAAVGALILLALLIPTAAFAQEGKDELPRPPEKAAEAPKDLLVADFEESTPEGSEVLRAKLEVVKGEEKCPAGSGYLKIEVPEDRRNASQLLFTLPDKSDLQSCKSLSAHIDLPEKEGEWKLRWNVLDKDKNQIWQRMFKMEGGEGWQKVEWPLYLWRWSNGRTASWTESKYLVLNIEEGSGDVKLDDIKFLRGLKGNKSAFPEAEWVAKVAFTGEYRSLNEKGVFIATDALEELDEAALKSISDKVTPIIEWMKAIFRTARRPVNEGAPVSLLVFKDMDGYKKFYERLGEQWNVSIGAPGAGGYTVQDIAASTYSARYGADRPVYFHELVHAIASRELRLLPGQRRHSWLQEGLANYLQLCLYPKSLGRSAFVNNFSQRITRRSFFKPLRTLLTMRISGRQYAQLASLVAFLAEKHPDWLDKIALGIADGKDIEKVLEGLDLTFDSLQEKWLEWGKKVFASDAEAPEGSGTHFPTPAQWKKTPEKPEEEKKETPKEEETPKKESESQDF